MIGGNIRVFRVVFLEGGVRLGRGDLFMFEWDDVEEVTARKERRGR